MKKRYTDMAASANWWDDNALSVAKLAPELRSLVCTRGSLTSALTNLSNGNFGVSVVRQRLALPYFHEQKKLKRPLLRGAMIREVELQLYGESVVFARSIIPLSFVTKGRNGFANLGRTPLGHLLFRDGKIRVSKREFTQIDFDDWTVTARRTPYDYHGSQILVSEYFLPSIAKYL